MMLSLFIACAPPKTTAHVTDDTSPHFSDLDPCQEPLLIEYDAETDGSLFFGEAPAHGDPLSRRIALTNTCETDLIFMGEPNLWSNRAELSVQTPPNLRLRPHETTEMTLALYPGESGEIEGVLNIETDRGEPIPIQWQATIHSATPMLMLSQERHVALSLDYGNSIAAWTQLPGPESDRVRGICYGNGRAIVVGGDHSQVIWSSTDGINWTRDESESDPLNDCESNGLVFVGAESTPYYSLAGLVWEEGERTPWMHDPLSAIAEYQGMFIAVGGQGRVAATEDGKAWIFDESIGTFNLFALAQSPERILTVGQFGFVAWSDDGFSWTTQTVGNGIFQAAIYGDNVFLISDGSSLFRSTHAENWELLGESGIKPLAATGKKLIGFGNGQLYLSENKGNNWEEIASLPFSSPIIDTVYMR